MNRNRYSILNILGLMIIFAITSGISIAQSDKDVISLEPITPQNVNQLEPWIPIDQNLQQSKDWIAVSRGFVRDIESSPTDDLLAVGSSTGLYLFHIDNLNQAPIYVGGIGDTIIDVTFSADGRKIALKTTSEQLYVYDVESQAVVELTAVRSAERYADIQFGDDSAQVFAATYGESYQLVEWDSESGKIAQTIEIPELATFYNTYEPEWQRGAVTIPFTMAGDRIITNHRPSSSDISIIQIWDKNTLTQTLSFDVPIRSASLEYFAEQNIIVTDASNYQGAWVWDASTGNRLMSVSSANRPRVSPDGSQILFQSPDSAQVQLWDMATQGFVGEFDFEREQYIHYISTNQFISYSTTGAINLWTIDGQTLTKTDSVQAFTGAVGGLFFNATGDELTVLFKQAGIQIWDAEMWMPKSFIAVEQFIRAIAISPDDQTIAVGVGDYATGEKLRFYDKTTGEVIVSATYDRTIDSVAYHPSGDYIATGRTGFNVAFYSTQSATMLVQFSEGGIPYSVAFNPDGTLLASGNADSNVRVYDTTTRQPVYVIETGGQVQSLAFSHDGTMLATGTSHMTILDAKTGGEIHQSDYLGRDEINDLAFSPDDSLLATINSEQFALWDVESGELLWEVPQGGTSVAFHPDGNLIAVGHANITLWVINTGEDSDADGVDDIRDACPTEAGEVNGCPDRDADGFVDVSDECPDEVGTALGCPDDDADGVGNLDDVCPQEMGSIAANGCPDSDADGVVDSDDLCPAVIGVEEFDGCPDTDLDHVADVDDACPTYAGIPENEGCPQTGHTNTTSNTRISPSTNGAVVRSISASEEFYIIGRNEIGDWLQIVLSPDADATNAWVFSSLVVTDADMMTLPITG